MAFLVFTMISFFLTLFLPPNVILKLIWPLWTKNVIFGFMANLTMAKQLGFIKLLEELQFILLPILLAMLFKTGLAIISNLMYFLTSLLVNLIFLGLITYVMLAACLMWKDPLLTYPLMWLLLLFLFIKLLKFLMMFLLPSFNNFITDLRNTTIQTGSNDLYIL